MMHSIDDFDRLLHTLPVGVFVYRTKKDGSAEFDYVSKRCADLVGVEAALVMQDWNSLFASLHPDDAAGFPDTNARAIQFLRKYSWEVRFIVDGKIRWIHAESTPQPQENGDVVWNGYIADVTEQKASANEVTKSNTLSESIINSLPGIFYVIDRTGRFLRVNQRFAEVTGYSREEILRLHPLDLFFEDEKPLVDEKIKEVFEKE